MFRRTLFGVALAPVFAAMVGVTAWAVSESPDEAAVRATVQSYFDGMMEGRPELLADAFHQDAMLIGITSRGLTRIPFKEWSAAMTRAIPNPDQYHNRVVSVDIAGDAAIAKTDLDWPSVHYVDYLSLLRIDGEWKIVNKIWHQEPGTRAHSSGA